MKNEIQRIREIKALIYLKSKNKLLFNLLFALSMFLVLKKRLKIYKLIVDLLIVNLKLRSSKFKFNKVKDFIRLIKKR